MSTINRTTWLTYCPNDGFAHHDTEEEARRWLDGLLDTWRDGLSEGVDLDEPGRVALYRCERIAGIAVKVVAAPGDGTPDGERCREAGHDAWVELNIEEEG